jgi:hypothetical protein
LYSTWTGLLPYEDGFLQPHTFHFKGERGKGILTEAGQEFTPAGMDGAGVLVGGEVDTSFSEDQSFLKFGKQEHSSTVRVSAPQ